MITTILIIWLLLGIHSCWYFINLYTDEEDFPIGLSPIFLICLIAPIITHIATNITFSTNKNIILFKKKNK